MSFITRICQSAIAASLIIVWVPVAGQARIEVRADAVSMRAFGEDTKKAFLAKEKIFLNSAELSTISAIESVADGKIDLALSSRSAHPLNPKETGLVFVPIAFEAIVAIVHPDNPIDSISLRNLREIYAGRIKQWEQIGGHSGDIHLNSVAGPLDGIEYGLRQSLFGRGHIPIAAERWYLNTVQLEAGIAIDPNGIAVSTLSNVLGNPKLKRLKLEGVTATRSNIKQGEYLLVTPLYAVHRSDLASVGAVSEYLDFLQTDRTARLHMQRKKLLPVHDADPLLSFFATRQQELLVLLNKPQSQTIAPEENIAANTEKIITAEISYPESNVQIIKTTDQYP